MEESKETKAEETLGMKDTVEAEVGKGGAEKKNLAAAAKRNKAIALAHDKYVKANEAARIAYVTAKKKAIREFEDATK
ncbi:unnamed protein product [marine sediment metagenome]|uniref:Uncharacterized protein n=1 Tax=marine sediment metagenome TaxID=412755 RepID=X1PL62_9ZZZZ